MLLEIGYDSGDVLARLQVEGEVLSIVSKEESYEVTARLDTTRISYFEDYIVG